MTAYIFINLGYNTILSEGYKANCDDIVLAKAIIISGV